MAPPRWLVAPDRLVLGQNSLHDQDRLHGGDESLRRREGVGQSRKPHDAAEHDFGEAPHGYGGGEQKVGALVESGTGLDSDEATLSEGVVDVVHGAGDRQLGGRLGHDLSEDLLAHRDRAEGHQVTWRAHSLDRRTGRIRKFRVTQAESFRPLVHVGHELVDGSGVPIGERESKVVGRRDQQPLEGLLIPSANNFAFTLANWDAGSVDKFVANMNKRAKGLGLSHTKFADPAGASVQTVSTPSDLVALGTVAMSQEVFAQIVAKTSAKLPVAGTVYNVDYALGQSGLIGIKTGSGFNQGANFLFAASVTVGGFTKVMFGCVMGLPTLADAFAAAKTLIAAVQPILIVKRILSKYQSVGSYEPPWGGHAELLSTTNVDLVEWPGIILRQNLHAPALTINKPLATGTAAGVLNIVLGDYNLDVPLTTSASLYPPGRFWRLTRI